MSTVFSQQPWLDFYFNGHWASEFGLMRTSDGTRYNNNLIPTLTDKTVDIPGNDGQLFFNTYYKQRQFSISFAFDALTYTNLRAVQNWLSGKTISDLQFPEWCISNNRLTYHAKVTGTPQIKYIPFDIGTISNPNIVYKGEGSVQFTCYDPYGYDVDITRNKDSSAYVSGIVEAIFTVSSTSTFAVNSTITIQTSTNSETDYTDYSQITLPNGITSGGLLWNGATGAVTCQTTSTITHQFMGNSMINLPLNKYVKVITSDTDALLTFTIKQRYL